MAELMLVRREDRALLDKIAGGLHFLVFDERHTYRGRQGADVAMLIRRLKERAASPSLIHIGTSATMIARRDATSQERRSAVAAFATNLFGHPFTPEAIIEERLQPSATGTPPTATELRAVFLQDPASASSAASAQTTADFLAHPLTRRIESTLGLEFDPADNCFRRRPPLELAEAAKHLSQFTGLDESLCHQHLITWLVTGSQHSREHGQVFAFKLHQFIAQSRALWATLEPPDKRDFSFEGQWKTSP